MEGVRHLKPGGSVHELIHLLWGVAKYCVFSGKWRECVVESKWMSPRSDPPGFVGLLNIISGLNRKLPTNRNLRFIELVVVFPSSILASCRSRTRCHWLFEALKSHAFVEIVLLWVNSKRVHLQGDDNQYKSTWFFRKSGQIIFQQPRHG